VYLIKQSSELFDVLGKFGIQWNRGFNKNVSRFSEDLRDKVIVLSVEICQNWYNCDSEEHFGKKG